MTAASHEPPLSRAVTLLAHSMPYVIVAAIGARIASWVITWPPVLDDLIAFAPIFAMIALIGHMRNGALCLRCIRDTPLNPQRDVDRNKPFLWFAHLDRRRFWRYYLIVLVPTLLAVFVFTRGIPKILLDLPLDVFFFSMLWSYWVHHRLHPWCPYCRGWDDGGDPEFVPDPDPAEASKR